VYSVLEENLSPLSKLISSLVKVVSLVEASRPLDEVSILDLLLGALLLPGLGWFLSIDEICVIEFLIPAIHLALISFAEESTVRSLELTVARLEVRATTGQTLVHSSLLSRIV